MLAVERELTAAIYLLYAIDCTHWIKAGQAAVTRRIGGGWRIWEHRADGFTLLGFAPVFVHPFDLRPGWFVLRSHALSSGRVSRHAIQKFLRRAMPRGKALAWIATLAALNQLLLLPVLLLLGVFQRFWPLTVSLLVATHATLMVETYQQAEPWRRCDRGGFLREYVALLLNPVAALRAADVLGRKLFESERKSDAVNGNSTLLKRPQSNS
jgi:hypothetical protein